MNLKLGKKPATRDDRDLLFLHYRTAAAPEAPVGFDHTPLVTQPWGMLGNDTVGDCAIAGPAHETMLLNAEAGKQIPFTTQGVLQIYSAITGYNPNNPNSDQGSNVRDVLTYRATTGFADAAGHVHKIGAYVALSPGDWTELLQALYLFETVGIGIQVPQSAMQQFQDGQPWDVTEESPIEGGHYIPAVARPATNMATVITWGAKQLMTQAFYAAYCDEAWCYLSEEDLAGGKTLEGFDVDELQADLEAL